MLDRQLAKLQNFTDLFKEKTLHLRAKVELLRPALLNESLVQQHKSKGSSHGFNTLKMALAELCLINASALLSSTDKGDVSISSLIRYIRDRNTPIYKKLKGNFSEPLLATHLDSQSLSPEELEEFNRISAESEREDKEEQFDRLCDEVSSMYDSLMQDGIGKKIKEIRNQVLAHIGTRRNGKKLSAKTTADYGLIVNDVFEIVDHVETLAEKFALIICNQGWITDGVKRQWKQEAETFWEQS